jgi:hypothetical protein
MTLLYQNGWETVENFDFSSLITAEDQQLAMQDIEQVIANGNYFKNSPPYQTNINIFNHPGEHWLKFRMSFTFSCFMYLKKEVKIDQIQSWSFMTSNATVENRDDLWHTHQYGTERALSGIWYLHIPDDVEDLTQCGTEFAVNGVDHPERWVSEPHSFSWIIYPGKLWHRPMPPQSSKNRFIIAADMIF